MTVEQERRTDAMWVPAKGDADGWQALAKEYAILLREYAILLSDDGRCDSLQSSGQPCTRCKARHFAFEPPYADSPGANGYLDRMRLNARCIRTLQALQEQDATGSREAEAANHATTDSISGPTPSSVVTTPPRSVAWWNALRLCTTAELAELGCLPWGEDIVRQGGRHLMLFPGSWHGRIPHGYVVWDISGDIREFDPTTHDDETRGGALAFGLMASQDANAQDANATSERERHLDRRVDRLRKKLKRMGEQLAGSWSAVRAAGVQISDESPEHDASITLAGCITELHKRMDAAKAEVVLWRKRAKAADKQIKDAWGALITAGLKTCDSQPQPTLAGCITQLAVDLRKRAEAAEADVEKLFDDGVKLRKRAKAAEHELSVLQARIDSYLRVVNK